MCDQCLVLGYFFSALNLLSFLLFYFSLFTLIQAWKLEFEASASVGFKLAFSYLKCRRFVEAIDVCELVLGQYPDYPRIADEILRKAQDSIRTAA